MSNQPQPPIITIKFVPAGVELVLGALNKLPREQSDALFKEVLAQYQYQMEELQKQAQAEALIAESKAKAEAVKAEAQPEGAAE
jgi:hypothetical protein